MLGRVVEPGANANVLMLEEDALVPVLLSEFVARTKKLYTESGYREVKFLERAVPFDNKAIVSLKAGVPYRTPFGIEDPLMSYRDIVNAVTSLFVSIRLG